MAIICKTCLDAVKELEAFLTVPIAELTEDQRYAFKLGVSHAIETLRTKHEVVLRTTGEETDNG